MELSYRRARDLREETTPILRPGRHTLSPSMPYQSVFIHTHSDTHENKTLSQVWCLHELRKEYFIHIPVYMLQRIVWVWYWAVGNYCTCWCPKMLWKIQYNIIKTYMCEQNVTMVGIFQMFFYCLFWVWSYSSKVNRKMLFACQYPIKIMSGYCCPCEHSH